MTLFTEELTKAMPAALQVAQDLGVSIYGASLALSIVAAEVEANPAITAAEIERKRDMTPEAVQACLKAMEAQQ